MPAKDPSRDLDLSGAANYKQMLLLGSTRRPPGSCPWWDHAPQLNSSNERQGQAFV